MKHRKSKRAENIALTVVSMLAIAWLIFLARANADGWGQSRDGWEWPVPFTTDIACDSGLTIFYYPPPEVGTPVEQDRVSLYPVGDSTSLIGTGLGLDSLGTHWTITLFWPRGASPVGFRTDTGHWYHDGPTLYVGAAPGGGHLCTVWGYVWTLQETGKNHVTLTFSVPDQSLDTCDAVIIASVPQKTETDVNGRFTIPLMQTTCLISPETGQPVEWQVEASWTDEQGMGRTRKKSFSIPADSLTYNLVF